MENFSILTYFEKSLDSVVNELNEIEQSAPIFDKEMSLKMDVLRNRANELNQFYEELHSLRCDENELNADFVSISKGFCDLIDEEEANVQVTPPEREKSEANQLQEEELSREEPRDSVGDFQNVAKRYLDEVDCGKTVEIPTKVEKKAIQRIKFDVANVVKKISDEEFKNVPSYMKGRTRSNQVNEIVDKFNVVLNAKYALVSQGMKGVSRDLKDKLIRYKDQDIQETRDQRFCVEEDLKEVFSAKDIQMFTKQVVQILRHCKRIKEIRSGTLIRYVVLYH